MAFPDLLRKTAAWLELKSSDAKRADAIHRVGIEHYPPRAYHDLLSKYRRNPVVRRATLLCAHAVAAIEPIVKVNGQEDGRVALRIAEILKKPNPYQDRFGFIRDLAAFKKLSGNGWVEANPGITKDYIEQYALRPERMRIEPGPTGFPQNYVYQAASGARQKYWDARGVSGDAENPGRILHIKDFAPDDDLFGAGALEAAEGPLALYESAQTLARNLFDNGLLMSGILSYDPQVPAGAAKPGLTPEQRTGLQAILDKFKLGKSRAGTAMIADASLKWVPMSTNLVDLQAEEIRNQAARGIANGFGVPPMLLGIPGDNTFANFREASRGFYRSTVIPDATELFGALGRWYALLTRIPGVTLEINEDKMWALAEEIGELWARVDNAQGLSIDERREAKGWAKLNVPGSDIVLVSAGLIPLEQVLNGGLPPGVAPEDYERPPSTRDGDNDGNFNEGQPDQHA